MDRVREKVRREILSANPTTSFKLHFLSCLIIKEHFKVEYRRTENNRPNVDTKIIQMASKTSYNCYKVLYVYLKI